MKFIKDLDIGEVWANYTKSYIVSAVGEAVKYEFTTWNSAYLHRESSATDADPDDGELEVLTVPNPFNGFPKHYI